MNEVKKKATKSSDKWQPSEFVRLMELIAIHGRLRATSAFKNNEDPIGVGRANTTDGLICHQVSFTISNEKVCLIVHPSSLSIANVYVRELQFSV